LVDEVVCDNNGDKYKLDCDIEELPTSFVGKMILSVKTAFAAGEKKLLAKKSK